MTKITKEYIYMLSEKWLNGTISEQEKKEYDSWYSSFNDNEVYDLDEEDLIQLRDRVYRRIASGENFNEKFPQKKGSWLKKNRNSLFWAVAASFSIFILVGYLLYSAEETDHGIQQTVVIKPGRNQATLIIENKVVVNLDSITTGDILREKGVRVKKTEEDELIYSLLDSQDASESNVFTSTVATPRGGQYKLALPDGSVVWLNAASSLTFPSHFIDSSRVVELTGEAYFEVAKNQNKPFKVVTDKAVVAVLGTSFNINAYEDESTLKTTLIEGRVELITDNSVRPKPLVPGQEAVVLSDGEVILNKVNSQDAIAWKNGEFMFVNEDIRSVMRRIARWYDVELIYQTNIENVPIWGSISRYDDIAEVLKIIELTEAAHFKIVGRRVYVMR